MLEKIAKDFLFGRVLEAAAAPSITEKLEEFLRVVEEQRANQLRRTPGLASDAIFTSSHMKEIHKEWMNDYESWMNTETVQEYERLRNGRCQGDTKKAHHLRRSAFSAYLFQIIGNKHAMLASIQHPICNAAQPADAIRRCLDNWEPASERKPGPRRCPRGSRSRSRTPR